MSKTLKCDCGFSWKEGESGQHGCGPYYLERMRGLVEYPIDPGNAIMPRQLTAENGAKGLLSGEFSVLVPAMCPECKGEGDVDPGSLEVGCEVCDDNGTIDKITYIDWPTIKEIYAKCVEGLEVKQ